jgi:ribosomal protein L44E
MIPELYKDKRLFCAACETYVDKVIEVIQVGKDSYLKMMICLKCLKELLNG